MHDEFKLKYLHFNQKLAPDEFTRSVHVYVRQLGGLNSNVPSSCSKEQIAEPKWAFEIIFTNGEAGDDDRKLNSAEISAADLFWSGLV